MDVTFWLSTLRCAHRHRSQLVRDWRDGLPLRWPAGEKAQDPEASRRYATALLEQCKQAEVEVLTPGDPRYPTGLLALHDPPPALFVRGEVSTLDAPRRVGVVGARRGSERARIVAENLGGTLASAGVVVVSGLAEGVDGAAHEGALDRGGKAIGVLGTGVQRVYPSHHRALHERVAAAGCLVSELPPDEGPRAHQFLARNRILAALSRALVVVEAGRKSGALSTVDFTLQLGQEVMAVPGPVDSVHVEGSLSLLRDGATLVRHGGDVLESLGWEGQPGPSLTMIRPQTPEEIARRAGWTIDATLARLTELELTGEIRRYPGGRFGPAPPGRRPSGQ